jgi:transcriptional regulator with PAS, ATPase and Fis domain
MHTSLNDIIGKSAILISCLDRVKRIMESDSDVLILGESGVGKELIAKTIHYNSSRRNHKLVSINCALIPETLLESELFGYEKGAFTGANANSKLGKFEIANKGTIFLDEIGDLQLYLQGKILRVLQEREIERLGGNKVIPLDIRVISATNHDLPKMVAEGLFREDLYYRINVTSVTVPPLRKRKDDIDLLCDHFLSILRDKYHREARLSYNVMTKLKEYKWPGNVRELKNVIEHSYVMSKGNVIRMEDIPEYIDSQNMDSIMNMVLSDTANGSYRLDDIISTIEKKVILDALAITKFSKTRAIKMLGISRGTFYKKLKKYNIPINEDK